MRLEKTLLHPIEVIGEASKKLPSDVKAMQLEIAWRKVAGMRERIIHDSFGVDYTIVRDVASTKLADLRSKLQLLLESIEKLKPRC